MMETALKIRHRIQVCGESIRSVSRSTGLSRNTIRKYLSETREPVYRQSRSPARPVLGAWEDQLQCWLQADQQRPVRERRTAKKLYEQLVAQGFRGSYSHLSYYLRNLKAAEPAVSAYIPLRFEAGDALQFDWSEEIVVLGGIRQRVQVAHFRLCHSRQSFVIAYPRQQQEMVLDAFASAFGFYQGLPKRVIIDNPKTMVLSIKSGKERTFHPRFMALLNHYVVEAVACTPAAGWEKGQIERQVGVIRKQLFAPVPEFADLAALNDWLAAQCEGLAQKPHPEQSGQTIAERFEQEWEQLRPVGHAFDGYVEKTVRVQKTCLIQYDRNRYSVPCEYAQRQVSVRAYAHRIVITDGQQVLVTHTRLFNRGDTVFEPWHYVPLLKRKPGALRDGAPFTNWDLPEALQTLKAHYLARQGGDREFVELLLLLAEHGQEVVQIACELAIEQQTLQHVTVLNLIHRMAEPTVDQAPDTQAYPVLHTPPVADCQRYEYLCQHRHTLALLSEVSV